MGLYVDKVDGDFAIRSHQVSAAAAALQRAPFLRGFDISSNSNPNVVLKKLFADLFGIYAFTDDDGDFVLSATNDTPISYPGEEEHEILGVLAPFVESGSRVEIRTDEGWGWVWTFERGEVTLDDLDD